MKSAAIVGDLSVQRQADGNHYLSVYYRSQPLTYFWRESEPPKFSDRALKSPVKINK